MVVLGIDAGGNETKIVGRTGVKKFSSVIGSPTARDLNGAKVGTDDMHFIYHNKGAEWEGFAGALARVESRNAGTRKGSTKAHKEAMMRILLAAHTYSKENEFQIVVGQPIVEHKEAELNKIKEMLLLEDGHDLTVNGKRKTIYIRGCEVAPEGVSVGLLHPQRHGIVRTIDVGSGTVNLGSLLDLRFVNQGSDTLPRGLESGKRRDKITPDELAVDVVNYAIELGWELTEDHVRLIGGGAERLYPILKEDITDLVLFKPVFDEKELDPVFANALAFYEMAMKYYG